MDSTKSAQEGSPQKQAAPVRWLKQLIVYGIVFLAGAAIMFFLGRHLWNFYNLYSGSQDRSLMAIDSANLDGETLHISFIRSEPDKPSGAFVLSGHKPGHSNISDPNLPNSVNGDTVTFDGMNYEILFEATDPESFPDRSGLIPFDIKWINRERGTLSVGPVNQRAINHITSYRAFLLLTKDDGEFYTANITVEP